MYYLTADDFEQAIREDQLNTIIQGNTALLDSAVLAAVSEAESFLRQRYNVAQVWAQTGGDRFPVLVMYLADMALYHLHSRINPRKVPELRMDRYDAAKGWLAKVADGKISPDLPLLTDGADNIRWGSNSKLGHSY
jgi:phage gp36-like protein